MFKNTMLLLVISLFVLINIAIAQTNITRVEYYVDTDPGYGNALAASITNSPNVTTTINVPVSNFTPGLHIVGVRSRDANGVWSFDERWLLLKPAAADVAANINKVEWYLDTDPGYDKATVFTGFTAGTDVANISIPVDITNISTGLHIAGIRTKDAAGKWSFDERWLILKQDTARIASKIDKVEWYLDTDPGYDKANSVFLTSAQEVVNLPFSPDISNLSTGLHILGVRSRNAEKSWSFDERWLILKQDTARIASKIDRVEWYIDTDPGYGKADTVALIPGQDLQNLSFSPTINNLSTGLHILGVRSRNAEKSWSFDERWLVLKQDTARIASKIDKVEWYIDTDPGYGKADSVPLTSAQEVVNLPFSPDISNLSTGLHILGVRSRNAEKSWSFDERWLLLKQDTAVKRQPITYMEYFIDSLDPGRGKAFPLAILPDTTLANLVSFVNVTGLDTGLHKIHYRSKDANGAWSFDETISFALKDTNTSKIKQFISLNSVASTNVCKGGEFLLGYHATGTFNAGNQFIAELSDEAGSFANATTIGSVNSNSNGGTINTTIPQNVVDGSGYKMRIRSTNPELASNATNQNISLNKFVLGSDTYGLILCVENNFDLTKYYEPLGASLSWSISNPTEVPVGIYSVYATNAVGCKDTASFSVEFLTAYWTGAVSTDWHTAANWSTGKVPNESTHVIVKNTAIRQCIISTIDAKAASLQVLSGALAVQISINSQLLILGKCTQLPK